MIASHIINQVVKTIAEKCSPERVIVFGSCASGTDTADSDLDLLVVMESDQPRHKRAVAIRRLFDHAPCPMDILVFTPEEVRYWNGVVNHVVTEAFRTGRVAFERKAS